MPLVGPEGRGELLAQSLKGDVLQLSVQDAAVSCIAWFPGSRGVVTTLEPSTTSALGPCPQVCQTGAVRMGQEGPMGGGLESEGNPG